MAEERVWARRLADLLRAYGWKCTVNRGTVQAIEPAFNPTQYVFVVGQAQSIMDEEVTSQGVETVIVPDNPPSHHWQRLTDLVATKSEGTSLTTFTRFVDRLFDAPLAAEQAGIDAQQREELHLFEQITPSGASPQSSHITQQLTYSRAADPDETQELVSDVYLVDRLLPENGAVLTVVAPAGLGKTELLKVHEWRTASSYKSAAERPSLDPLPPIALRVRLRGLPGLSLPTIAQSLTEPTGAGGVFGLSKIPSGAALRALLTARRIILLLDGLDEMKLSREELARDLRELRDAALEGARVIITTREGHYESLGPVYRQLADQPIAKLQPLRDQDASKLLSLYGASEEEIRTTLLRLPSTVKGNPLFLLLGLAAGTGAELPDRIRTNPVLLLQELLKRFCERDIARVRLDARVQMRMLMDLASWLTFVSELDADEAYQLLGLTPGEAGSGMVENPHALLEMSANGQIQFRYKEFQELFTSSSIEERWQSEVPDPGLISDLSRVQLGSSALQYLGHLLNDARIRTAWTEACSNDKLRMQPWFRRNLLGVALERLEQRGTGEAPIARAQILEDIIGNRDLAQVSLSGLTMRQLDLSGWDLTNLRGLGGYVRYCDLRNAKIDDSLSTVTDLEGTLLPSQETTQESLQLGLERLEATLKPWRARTVDDMALKPRVAASTKGLDYEGMVVLRRHGIAEVSRGPRGDQYWELTDEGRSTLRAFLERRDMSAVDETILRDLASLR